MFKPGMMSTLGIAKKRAPAGPMPSFKPMAAIPKAAAGDTASPLGEDALGVPGANDPGGEGKISPEEVDYSANDTCESCVNNEGGQCSKYKFSVESSGHCEAGYSPRDDGSSSDLGTGPPAGGLPGGQ